MHDQKYDHVLEMNLIEIEQDLAYSQVQVELHELMTSKLKILFIEIILIDFN